MSDAVAWWREHKNSPGMNGSSKRALLQVLQDRKAKDFDAITADMTPPQRQEWDAVFADDYAELCHTIREIEESLK